MVEKMISNQNDSENLKLLAAQRLYYSETKSYNLLYTWLCIGVIVILSLIRAIVKWLNIDINIQLDIIYVFYCASISIIGNEILLHCQKLQKKGAQFQEIFDSTILVIDPNRMLTRSNLSRHDIEDINRKYLRKFENYNDLENWYPNSLQCLPPVLATIQCQRTNCEYDLHERAKYKHWITFQFVVLIIGITVFSFAANLDFTSSVLTFIIPPLPLILWFRKTQTSLNSHFKRLDEIHEATINVWDNKIKDSSKDVKSEIRQIQDSIYQSRLEKVQIPDWIYFKHRAENEKAMKEATQFYINQYTQTLKDSK